jgi:hypothetical protein
MRSTLQITNVETTVDGDIAIEFDNSQVITLSQQKWEDEIYQCQTNYPLALMRSLLVQQYLTTNAFGSTAVFDTDAPNNAWIEKSG